MDNTLLEIAKKIQALAQTGLTYSLSKYDTERYQQLRELSVELLHCISNEKIEKITDLFASEKGYQTPKVDVRGVVFRENKILLVKESLDGKWSIPGGWADIGLSPFTIAAKEIQEESGLIVKPVKLLAVLDKYKHPHPPDLYHVYKLFILCIEIDGELKAGMETTDVNWFAENEIPTLSELRNTESQIKLMFEYLRNPEKNVICD
ncbi:MAG: NUDIX hydrolase [Bacteroidales bacterium]|nr:NUDIX hydrolase [Bacteroidales bacterium]